MNTDPRPPYSSFNRWFLIPFILWVLLGGIALLLYDQQVLFAAVNTRHTPLMDSLMVLTTRLGEGVFGTAVLLTLLAFKSFRNWWYFSAAFLCNALPAILVQVIKSSVNAPRPLNVFKDAQWIHHLPEWERLMERSFPSGHACAAFCLFTFLAFILRPKYKWIGFLFLTVALLVAYSRMYLAAHFFLDIYVGSILGVLFTILAVSVMRRHPHYFFRRPKPENRMGS